MLDAANIVRMDNDNDIIIQINQSLFKPDEDVLLMSTFQVRCNDTIIDTS